MADPLSFREGEPVTEPAVTIEAFLDQSNATAVLIEPGTDVRQLLPHLDRISLVVVDFPSFADGRGYSAAQILREEGYTGELRASGDVLIDQIRHMRRCGFDSFAPEKPISREAANKAIDRFADVYQCAADERTPVWKLRHG